MRLLFLFLLLPKKKKAYYNTNEISCNYRSFETIHKEDKKTDKEIHPTTIP